MCAPDGTRIRFAEKRRWKENLGTTIPGLPLGPGVGHKRILLLGGGELASVSAIRLVVGSHFATGAQLPALRDLALGI